MNGLCAAGQGRSRVTRQSDLESVAMGRPLIALLFAVAAVGCAGCVGDDSGKDAFAALLRCPPGIPADSLTGFDRCVVERFRPCTVDRQLSAPFTTRIEYDGDNRVERREVTDPAEATYHYEGRRLGMREQVVTDPALEEYDYDGAGRLVEVRRSITEPMMRTYHYDERGRLDEVEQTITDPHRLTLGYDEAGRVAEVERSGDAPSITRYIYDDSGLIVAEDRDGARMSYEYDNRGRLQTTRGPGAEIVYAYDDAGRLVYVQRSVTDGHTIDLFYEGC